MRVFLGLLALGILGVLGSAKPSIRKESVYSSDSDKTLIRVLRADLENEEPVENYEKKNNNKKRSIEKAENLKRSRRAHQEDEFFQALLSRSANTKKEQKRSFDDNGPDNKGYIIRDDWKGDSKISDADRTELENLFSAINAPEASKPKIEETRSIKDHDEKMYDFVQWLVSQSPSKFSESLSRIVDLETSLSKMIYNSDFVNKLKAQKAAMLADSVAKNTTAKNKTSDTKELDAPLDDKAAREKFCKTRCYDINVAGINCRIICHPPHIDTTGGLHMMQQMPYQPCTNPQCGMGAGQTPCSPPGCYPGGYGQTAGYPGMAGYPAPYGGVVPPQTVYKPHPAMMHGHGNHHGHGKPKIKKVTKGKAVKGKAKAKKGGKSVHDKHPALSKQHDDSSNSTDSSSSESSKSSSSKQMETPDIPSTEEIDSEYEYEGPGAENEVDYEHPHWVHHQTSWKEGMRGGGAEEGLGGGGGGGGGGGRGGRVGPGIKVKSGKGKPAYGPVTLNTLGATVHVTPMSFSSPGGPVMNPAGIAIGPPQPQMATAPLLPQVPQSGYPPQSGYALQPIYPPKQDEPKDQEMDEASDRSFKPMPNDCTDYASERCRVFLDWPTDEYNEIKASLRFKQNWHPDYLKKNSAKYKIFKAEIEKALRDAYTQDPNFAKATVTSFSEEDMKTAANFKLKFLQAENGALRWLSRAVSNNYLQAMPVFSSTLLRDGMKHSRRQFVPNAQKELDKLHAKKPKKQVKTAKEHKNTGLLDSESESYQGCYRDKKPERDLPVRFSKFSMTPEWCVGRCKLAGYKFAGLQYAYLCFCGNKYGKYGMVDDGDCSSKCYGDKSRFCGSFWHNSVYSIDGQKHDVAEFKNDKEDDDDEEDEGSTNEDPDKKINDEGHAAVATHLMKAAEAALKAAKKLLPQGKKEKRMAETELEKEKAKAVAALGAAQDLMESNERELKVKKRQADLNEGRDLLVSYLGNVGGYERQYRDVEGQEDGEENARKFEYRRMVIDESGDGEFVEKDDKKSKKRRKRAASTISGESYEAKKRRRRSVLEEEPTGKKIEKKHKSPVPETKHLEASDKPEQKAATAPQPKVETTTADQPKEKTADQPKVETTTADQPKEKTTDQPKVEAKTADQPKEKTADQPKVEAKTAEKPEKKPVVADVSKATKKEENVEEKKESDESNKEKVRKSRSVDEEEEEGVELIRMRRELSEKPVKEEEKRTDRKRDIEYEEEKAKKEKRDIWLDDAKVDKMKTHINQGIKSSLAIILDIFKEKKTIESFRQAILKLKEDVAGLLSVPKNEQSEVKAKIREIIDKNLPKEASAFIKKLRNKIGDYGATHVVVAPQASEAEKAILDLPVLQEDAKKAKKHIRKRSAELSEEIKKATYDNLPSILKEHFKRNTNEKTTDKKKRSLNSH